MEKAPVAVVMVPIPAQSHLNQLLRLAALISSTSSLPVHYLGSATHNRQVKLRNGPNHNPIHFHDLPTPPIATPDPDPSPYKIPVHLGPAVMAYMELRRPIAALIQQMSMETQKIVLIYDRLIAEAVSDAVLIPNVESYAFNCLPAFYLLHILWESLGKPFPLKEDITRNLQFSINDFTPANIINFIVSKPEHFKNRAGDIHNTIRLIEGEYIDLLAREEIGGKKQHWAISPTLGPKKTTHHETRARHECLAWLDGQVRGSVVYISFGTTISLSQEEAREMAIGLESCGHKFIWVLRDADRADIFSGRESKTIELPDRFEERVKKNGLVVRDWAPQMEILAHEATGAFLTHCGWNSCFESLMTGVPMLTWPMHSDQPLNAIFMTEVLKTGLVLKDWGKREELVKACVVKGVIERLMATEEGEEIRRRAAEISATMRKAAEDDGECRRELESFIEHISKVK